jgi:hypothetical protein
VTFNLYANASGSGPALFTDTETLVGGQATSASYTPTAVGTVYWVATFNGDSLNPPEHSGSAAEPVTVVAAPTPPALPVPLWVPVHLLVTPPLPGAPGVLFGAVLPSPPLVSGQEVFGRPPVWTPMTAAIGLGEEKLGAISGTVFLDSYYDGVRHDDDPGLYLQDVVLEQQGYNGRLERVATARTDAAGWYIFMGLKPGLYRVRVRLSPEYAQSTKADEDGVYVVTMRDSFHYMNRDFGVVYDSLANKGRVGPAATQLVRPAAALRDEMFEHWTGPGIGGDGAKEEAAFQMDFSISHASTAFRSDEAFIPRARGDAAAAGLALGALLVSQTAPGAVPTEERERWAVAWRKKAQM